MTVSPVQWLLRIYFFFLRAFEPTIQLVELYIMRESHIFDFPEARIFYSIGEPSACRDTQFYKGRKFSTMNLYDPLSF